MKDKFVYCIENRYIEEDKIFTKDKTYEVSFISSDTLLIEDDRGLLRNIIVDDGSIFTKPTTKEELRSLLHIRDMITKTMGKEEHSMYTKGSHIGINSDNQLVLFSTNKNISAILAPITFLLDMCGEALIVELKNNSFYVYPEKDYTWKKLDTIVKLEVMMPLMHIMKILKRNFLS